MDAVHAEKIKPNGENEFCLLTVGKCAHGCAYLLDKFVR